MPLFFDLDNVSHFEIPIRVTPNKAYDAYIPHKDGICGQWIRPEDLDLYEPYATVCEFRTFDIQLDGNYLIYEKTLLNIYKNEKKWTGSLNDIVKDLGLQTINPGTYDDLGKRRLNCKQTCQLNRCHFCLQALKFGDTVKKYGELKKTNTPTISEVEFKKAIIPQIDPETLETK